MKYCAQCGQESKIDDLFCGNCGRPLRRDINDERASNACPNGHLVVPGARFCHLCAAKIDGANSEKSNGQNPAFTATSASPGELLLKRPAPERQGVSKTKRTQVIVTSLAVLVIIIVAAVLIAEKVAGGNGYIIAASAGDFRSVNGQQVIRDSGQSLSFQIGWDDSIDDNSDAEYSCGPTWAPANASDPNQWSKGCNEAGNYVVGGPSGTWQARPFPGNPQGSGL
jgi:hypothetical protein